MKNYYTFKQLETEAIEYSEKGVQKGLDIGFRCMQDAYSIKSGCTSYVMGSPVSGKTELWFEFLVNLTEKYSLKHAIFTPETGDKVEIAAELCHKYIGKPFFKNKAGCMSESERFMALNWLNESFFIIDPSDNALSMEDFYKTVDTIEKDCQIKIDTTTIDPFNELTENLHGERDLHIEKLLTFSRKNARATGRHNCIITHCRDQVPVKDGDITYFPPPTARDYAGGQVWFRKGQGMLSAWRPVEGHEYRPGKVGTHNEVVVEVQKAKPKGIGTHKANNSLYFNTQKNRYYELSYSGIELYAWDYLNEENKEKIIFPNENFLNEPGDVF